MNAALFGGSSGGLVSQSRTRIDKVPKITEPPTGASIRVTFAATLSSPCKVAIGWGIIAAGAAEAAKAAPSAAAAGSARLIYGKG
jgi:hypothetical protein